VGLSDWIALTRVSDAGRRLAPRRGAQTSFPDSFHRQLSQTLLGTSYRDNNSERFKDTDQRRVTETRTAQGSRDTPRRQGL